MASVGRGQPKLSPGKLPIEVEDSFLGVSLRLGDFSSCPPVGLVEPPPRSPHCSFLLLFYFLPLVSSCFLTPGLFLAPNLAPLLVISVVDCGGTVTLHVLFGALPWS